MKAANYTDEAYQRGIKIKQKIRFMDKSGIEIRGEHNNIWYNN